MRCPKPRQQDGRGVHPCGGCIICRKNKAKFWTARILLEQMATPHLSWFATLTYDDDHLPRTVLGDVTLEKRKTQQWVQDYLKAATPEQKFRYYLVGEYGDRFGRPHYHMALFPNSAHFSTGEFLDAWKKGQVKNALPLITNRAEYLARYCLKKLTSPTDDRLEEGQEPEFRSSSRVPALGLIAVDAIARAYETRQGSKVLAERGDVQREIRINGKKYPLDKYILDKLRTRFGIPLTHERRLTHMGYYQWHQNPDLETDLPRLDREIHRHAQRQAARTARSL